MKKINKNEKRSNRNPKIKKKVKIFGIKHYALYMLDIVFRPQEHDAIG